MRILLAILFCINIYAVEVPDWVLVGILKVETRSEYREDGTIKYVDKRRGAAGERGPFQMTKGAFNQIKKRGEQFWQIETDRVFAEECAKRYLVWLHTHFAKGDWMRTIEMYNAGPHGVSKRYLNAVIAAVN